MAKIIPITEHFQHFVAEAVSSGAVARRLCVFILGWSDPAHAASGGAPAVHTVRNILEHVRKRDYDEVKQGAQAILADSRAQAQAAFRRFRARWLGQYGSMVR